MEEEQRIIGCIDMRSFYASCAAVEYGLDVMKTAIAIVGNLQQKGSVVLAASPPAKAMGVKTGTRLYEIPKFADIQLIEPKMELYVHISVEITRHLLNFIPEECIHVYSIDETFFDLTHMKTLWGDHRQLIARIQDDLVRQFGIPSAVGVGPNMLMAKLALDLDAKKTGYAEWTMDDVPTKLWPVQPLSKMWGIGKRMEKNLNNMGIYKVGDLANADLKWLEHRFGVMGHQLYQHARGIDYSELGALILEGQTSYGKGQTLYHDYYLHNIGVVLLEICEDVAKLLRRARKEARTISLSITYSKHTFGGGFSRSRTFDGATNETMRIYNMCLQLLREFGEDKPIRHVAVSATNLEDESSVQLSLFEDEVKKWRLRRLGEAVDHLRDKYGSSAILRAVSYTEPGTAVERAKLLGGHKKK